MLRCFDKLSNHKLSNHKLNDHRPNDRSQDTEIDFQYWYSPVAEPVEATSFVGFFLWSFRCFDASTSSATTSSATTSSTTAGSMTEARTRKLIFSIGILQWLSLSKPPASLAFSGGRFDASMLRQAQQPQAQRPQAQ